MGIDLDKIGWVVFVIAVSAIMTVPFMHLITLWTNKTFDDSELEELHQKLGDIEDPLNEASESEKKRRG